MVPGMGRWRAVKHLLWAGLYLCVLVWLGAVGIKIGGVDGGTLNEADIQYTIAGS